MQVEIKMDSAYTEPKVILMTASMTEEVQRILKKLSEDVPQIISGSRDEKIEVLHQEDLIRIYADAGKIFAVTEKGQYVLRLRLYELEERLDDRQFVRISNSEIVNVKKIRDIDLSIIGRICIRFLNDTQTYVSRRYIPKIKKSLRI